MKFFLGATVLMALSLSAPVFAQSSSQAPATPRPPSAQENLKPVPEPSIAMQKLGFEWDSPIVEGQTLGVGQFVHSVRPFLNWNLVSERVEAGRTVSYLETQAKVDQTGMTIVVRLAPTKGKGNMFELLLPVDIDAAMGVSVKFVGMEKPKLTPVCDGLPICILAVPADTATVLLIEKSAETEISFMRGGVPVIAKFRNDGFQAAMEFLATGKLVIPAVAKSEPKPAGAKPALPKQ